MALATGELDETRLFATLAEVDAATREKDRLQDLIHGEFLLPMSAIARGNSTLDPGLARRFRAPLRSGDKSVYMGTARSILTLAVEHKPLFLRDGMPESFVEDLGQALDDYAAAATAVNTSRQLHVQARAELKVLGRQLMASIKRLDGINRSRFRKQPQLFQAWMAARNVAWPAVNPKLLAGSRQATPQA